MRILLVTIGILIGVVAGLAIAFVVLRRAILAFVRAATADEDQVDIWLRTSQYPDLSVERLVADIEHIVGSAGECGEYSSGPFHIKIKLNGPQLDALIEGATKAARLTGIDRGAVLVVYPERGKTRNYKIKVTDVESRDK